MIDIAKLKKLRKGLKLSQNEISKKTEITLGYYSEIETGKKTASLKTTVAIARAMGVTVNDILPDEVINPPQPSEAAPEPPGAEQKTA